MSENMRRAQLLADYVYRQVTRSGPDGSTQVVETTESQRSRLEPMIDLAQVYATLAVATGEGRVMSSDEREI